MWETVSDTVSFLSGQPNGRGKQLHEGRIRRRKEERLRRVSRRFTRSAVWCARRD